MSIWCDTYGLTIWGPVWGSRLDLTKVGRLASIHCYRTITRIVERMMILVHSHQRCEFEMWNKGASEKRTCVIFQSLFLHFQSSPFHVWWWRWGHPLNCIVSILNHAKIRSSIICYNDQMIDRSKKPFFGTEKESTRPPWNPNCELSCNGWMDGRQYK